MKPNIFETIRFREFLRQTYNYRKSQSKKFSHRYISQKVGASSAGWFSNILNGRISLTRVYILPLAKLFELDKREQEYFELLVHYGQAASKEELSHTWEKLLSFKGAKTSLIRQEQFEFYNQWHLPVIRELLLLYNYRGNPDQLGKLLQPAISAPEIEKAIQLLYHLKLIQKEPGGHPRPCDSNIKKDDSKKTDHWKNHMKDVIKLSADAGERFTKEERDISDVIIPLSPESFIEARQYIKDLRKKLITLSEKDKQRNRVFQCNIQLFPVTKAVN